MATGTYSPWIPQQFLDNNGDPLSMGSVQTFIAGTSTPVATFSDVNLTVQNANPIPLNSAGYPTSGAIFLSPGQSYKYIRRDSTGSQLAPSYDNILAIPGSSSSNDLTGTAGEALTAGQAVYLSDGSGGKTPGLWYKADAANTYSSTSPLLGVVPASIANGSSGTIRLAGQVTGLTSLTIGAAYYVGTAGALSTSIGTNLRFVGRADSVSTLVVIADPPLGVGGAFITGGNTFGATASLGLTDAFALSFKTNNVAFLSANAQQILSSSTQPRAVVYNNASQSLTDSVSAVLTFNTEDVDIGTMHDTGSNTGRLTVPTGGDGFYLAIGTTSFTGNATGYRQLIIRKNGTTSLVDQFLNPNSSSGFTLSGTVTWMGTLVATDYLELLGFQNSGGALSVGSATRADSSTFSISKLW